MTNAKKHLGNLSLNLYKILEEKGITKSSFAEGIGVTDRVVYDYLSGKKRPSLERFWVIVSFLEIDAEELVR